VIAIKILYKMRLYSKRLSRIYVLAIAGMLGLMSCSDDDSSMQAPDSAVNKALALIPGTVVSSEPETEEGIAAWKVEIRTDQGAEVEVYCRQDNGALLRIDGESGPFDYNIDPGNNLIDFDQAKTIGSGVTSEDLVEWRLRTRDKFNNIWVYELEFTKTKVYISAVDGNVLEVDS
jgi:uncharacterized membrane protein YkoI